MERASSTKFSPQAGVRNRFVSEQKLRSSSNGLAYLNEIVFVSTWYRLSHREGKLVAQVWHDVGHFKLHFMNFNGGLKIEAFEIYLLVTLLHKKSIVN